MKKIKLLKDNDWDCPSCKGQNNTERPGKTVQCSWCLKEYKVIKAKDNDVTTVFHITGIL